MGIHRNVCKMGSSGIILLTLLVSFLVLIQATAPFHRMSGIHWSPPSSLGSSYKPPATITKMRRYSTQSNVHYSSLPNRKPVSEAELWDRFLHTVSVRADEIRRKPKLQSSGTLVVATKPYPPFAIFDDQDNSWSGFAIDLAEVIGGAMGKTIVYWGGATTSVDDILDKVTNYTGLQTDNLADLAMSGITITNDREEFCDFSLAYFNTGGSVLSKQSDSSVWENLLTRFMLLIIMALVFILCTGANLTWYFEREKNPNFRKPYFFGIRDALWFSMVTSTTVGYGDKVPKTGAGKIVNMMAMYATLVTVSFFVAACTSALTVDSLKNQVSGLDDLDGETCGLVQNSLIAEYVKQEISCVPTYYDSVTEMCDAVKHGYVDGGVYEDPSLRYYQNSNAEVDVVGSLFDLQSYGVALREGSQLKEKINLIITQMWDDEMIQFWDEKWLGESSSSEDDDSSEYDVDDSSLIFAGAGCGFFVVLCVVGSICSRKSYFDENAVKHAQNKRKEKLVNGGMIYVDAEENYISRPASAFDIDVVLGELNSLKSVLLEMSRVQLQQQEQIQLNRSAQRAGAVVNSSFNSTNSDSSDSNIKSDSSDLLQLASVSKPSLHDNNTGQHYHHHGLAEGSHIGFLRRVMERPENKDLLDLHDIRWATSMKRANEIQNEATDSQKRDHFEALMRLDVRGVDEINDEETKAQTRTCSPDVKAARMSLIDPNHRPGHSLSSSSKMKHLQIDLDAGDRANNPQQPIQMLKLRHRGHHYDDADYVHSNHNYTNTNQYKSAHSTYMLSSTPSGADSVKVSPRSPTSQSLLLASENNNNDHSNNNNDHNSSNNNNINNSSSSSSRRHSTRSNNLLQTAQNQPAQIHITSSPPSSPSSASSSQDPDSPPHSPLPASLRSPHQHDGAFSSDLHGLDLDVDSE